MIEYITTLSDCDLIFWVRREIIYVGSYWVVFSIFALCNSYLFFKYNQFPLPFSYVFKKTPVVRGIKVKIQAITWLLIAFSLISGGIYLIVELNVIGIFSEQADIECLTSQLSRTCISLLSSASLHILAS